MEVLQHIRDAEVPCKATGTSIQFAGTSRQAVQCIEVLNTVAATTR